MSNDIDFDQKEETRIPRNVGFEQMFRHLVDKIDPQNHDGNLSFENDTFFISPFYEGDCVCDFEEKQSAFLESDISRHRQDCFQTSFKALLELMRTDEEAWFEELKRVYGEFGLPTDEKDWWRGCGTVCTCGLNEAAALFYEQNSHASDCPIVRPNFFFKPTSLAIFWYKYPFRSSYMSEVVSLEQFVSIVDQCVQSLVEAQHE